jgi:hypothetical protein
MMKNIKPYRGTNLVEVSFILISLGLLTLLLIPATIATPPMLPSKTNTPIPLLRQESVLFKSKSEIQLPSRIDEQCLQVALCRTYEEKPVIFLLEKP